MKVCLDPGHGGGDPGAIGRDPFTLREFDFAWAVTVATRALLVDRGHEVLVTQPQAGPKLLLKDRAQLANEWAADVFISIHANSVDDTRATGFEICHYGSDEGWRLASDVLGRLGDAFPDETKRGLKIRRELAVLRLTKMPAILIEPGFLSNPAGLEFLASSETQTGIAEAICGAVAVDEVAW